MERFYFATEQQSNLSMGAFNEANKRFATHHGLLALKPSLVVAGMTTTSVARVAA